MRRTIQVLVGDTPRLLGSIRYEAQGARESAAFEYDAAWLGAPDRFAIDPSLALVTGPQFHRRVRDGSLFHGAIADTSLPAPPTTARRPPGPARPRLS